MSSVPGKNYFSKMSQETGFKTDSLEKVYRLMIILDRIWETPELSDRLVLKGGTAIHGLFFGFSRLSVDIDVNYIGTLDKDGMEKDRKDIRKVLLYLLEDLGYSTDPPRSMYAEEQFNAHYKNIGGGQDRLKVEINYLERLPVAGTKKGSIKHRFKGLDDVEVLSYRKEELFAGKMRALILRGTPRDLYDVDMIARNKNDFDFDLWRKISLFYLLMYEGDVRDLSTERIEAVTMRDVQNNLQPLLRRSDNVDVDVLKGNVLPFARDLLDLSTGERQFFDLFYAENRVEQNILFDNVDVDGSLSQHPSIVWRLKQMKYSN
jgi:predicted nucleotidyltransferase component of viral defense system